MSIHSRSHEAPFLPTAHTFSVPPLQPGLDHGEAGQGHQVQASTDTPLTHSLLDTMGYAHNPPTDTRTCPIATRLLYNYTQGTAGTLLTPIERQAIHQKAAIDSYEQAKSYIVQSLFRIKDDSFRKVACCLVADYLGTQFLSQGNKQDSPRAQHDDTETEAHPMDEDHLATLPVAPNTASDLAQPTVSEQQQQQQQQQHEHTIVSEGSSQDAASAWGMQPLALQATALSCAAGAVSMPASEEGPAGLNVHALAEDPAGAALLTPVGHGAAAPQLPLLADTFMSSHPLQALPAAEGSS